MFTKLKLKKIKNTWEIKMTKKIGFIVSSVATVLLISSPEAKS
jgi:hypothetical protein